MEYSQPVDLTKPRRCENWLKTLALYVEDTESPRVFWLWSGIFTIASTLQRKVWLPFGKEPIYPCLYILLIAPPGELRKGAPVSLAKELLQGIKIPVFVDSPTKRALTQAMAELHKRQWFYVVNEKGVKLPKPHCSIALISKEFSSFLAVDPKAMIEVLTDIYDPHEEWEYKTSGVGADKLFGVCTSCLFASTPSWIANNLPEEAIGGGFTSRCVIITASEKYKWISIPSAPSKQLYEDLRADLLRIRSLVGEFVWVPEARALYDEWYGTIEELTKNCRDQRMRPFLARIHTIAIKVAMCLHAARADTLLIEPSDMGQAIALVTDVYETGGAALGGHGRSKNSIETDMLLQQLKTLGRASFPELLKLNFRNTNKRELEEALETLVAMGAAAQDFSSAGVAFYTWIPQTAQSQHRRTNTRWTKGLPEI
jgi:hypothetical protein